MQALQPENSSEYIDGLRRLIATKEQLKAVGYIVDPLTKEDFNAKRRCVNCGKRPKTRKPRKRRDRKGSKNAKNGLDGEESDADASDKSGGVDGQPKQDDKKEYFACQFHPGHVQSKHWTCCQQHVSVKKPCKSLHEHELRIYPNGVLEKRWAYYATPTVSPTSSEPAAPLEHARSNSQGQGQNWRRHGHRRGAQSEASAVNMSSQRRMSSTTKQPRQPHTAVALDCEMGTAQDGDSELIRLTVIDYFSGAVLIDSLVWPSVPMAHFNTRYSGVTYAQMQRALRDGTCIHGLQAAREKVWQFVGPDTIVIGHGANSDLSSLRWLHPCVIDTFQVEMHLQEEKKKAEEAKKAEEEAKKKEEEENKEENGEGENDENDENKEPADPETEKKEKKEKEKKPEERLSLKALTLRRLGRHIQLRTQVGHDSLEDAIATRDLVDWHVKQALDAEAVLA